MRQEFSEKVKVAAFNRAGGRCERCTALFVGGTRPEYDHYPIPASIGGPATLDNCMCICSTCHDLKTHKTDIPQIAKTKRIRAKHIGAAKQSRPMPGSRRSRFKKKMDGTVVER